MISLIIHDKKKGRNIYISWPWRMNKLHVTYQYTHTSHLLFFKNSCATVPRQRPPACRRPRYAAAPAFGVNTRSRRFSVAAVHCWQPCLSRGAARVWNSLPDFVTASTSLPMFKRHLKTVPYCSRKATKHWLFPTTWTPSIARHFLRLILYGVLAVVFDIMSP